MSNDGELGMDEKLLVIQFLGVLHTWLQEQRQQREAEMNVLAVQESLVKLLFARVSRPDLYAEPQFSEAGEIIFGGTDESWHDVFGREREALEQVGLRLTEEDMSNEGTVIDFFTRKKRGATEEDGEE
tara:strand:- start:100 stop:483 length:384 start_codon:yes stop_codon:yes gene_type:complete